MTGMDPSEVGLFALADQRLQWLGMRQSILAANVANADTPGWQARDVQPFDAMLNGGFAAAGQPARTHPMHLEGRPTNALGAHNLAGEHAPDGNQVSLDQQLEKIAQTDTQHETVTALYQKYLGMFRMTLGR